MTLRKQTSLYTQDQLMLSPGDFHANPTPLQEKERERKITDISGRQCLMQLKSFNHVGSSAKMFLVSLIGGTEWFSTKSRLIWKLRALKFSPHFYCQLVVKRHLMKGEGYGLLPTPRATDCMDQADLAKVDIRRARAKLNHKNGNGFGMTLGEMCKRKLLPTPNARDWKGKTGWKKQSDLNGTLQEMTGQYGLLNPLFSQEMMGFPKDWMLLPFLNGDAKPVLPQETQ